MITVLITPILEEHRLPFMYSTQRIGCRNISLNLSNPRFIHHCLHVHVLPFSMFPHVIEPFIANAPMFGTADATLAVAVTKAGGFGL